MKEDIIWMEAILAIFGDVLDHQELSEIVGLNPSTSWNKGDEIFHKTRSGQVLKLPVVRKEAAWEYSTGPIQTSIFDEMEEYILKIFYDKAQVIRKYVQERKLEIKIDVVVEIEGDTMPSISLSRRFISFLKELDAKIDFDMYLLRD